MAARAEKTTRDRALGARSLLSGAPDRLLHAGLMGLAALSLLVVGYFFVRLAIESAPGFSHQGLVNFLFGSVWDVSRANFGALPLIVGTLITSALALVIGVPIALATALFISELGPRNLRSPLTALVDLLAAVPSVVYGLWGIFVLIPTLRPAEQWFANTFGFLPFVKTAVAGPNYFIAGLILAIMLIPIVSSISREVIATVPSDQKEAAYALGATRWEVIRKAILPFGRRGIAGAAMLGLGRAIGETIVAVLVIGNAPRIGHSIFDQGYTLAAVLANEFGEAAQNPVHRGSLIAAGLVLFLITLIVNAIARYIVVHGDSQARVRVV